MALARGRTMRDAVLVLVGALCMHIASSFFGMFQPDLFSGDIIVNTQVNQHPVDPYDIHPAHPAQADHSKELEVQIPTTSPTNAWDVNLDYDFPETILEAHAPGWTTFRNLYMANGTLYVVSPHPYSDFPEIKFITSTGLYAENTPENIAARMPTKKDLSFITPQQARLRWGPTLAQAKSKTAKNRVFGVEGVTFLFNDPDQFLNHYYHFCAELWLGAWAFWQGTNNVQVDPKHADEITAPSITRMIFPHTDTQGWRDRPGFNSYFLRAVFPSITVEVDDDWQDRVAATAATGEHARAFVFERVLLADRSAAFRGDICGAQVHRTAAEAFYAMRSDNRLSKWWWEPVRRAVLRFAGVSESVMEIGTRTEKAALAALDNDVAEGDGKGRARTQKEKIVITYIDRQGVRRHLVDEDHARLVAELRALAENNGYEFNLVRAETLTKEQQLAIVARTTIMIGVHGNGLTHLIMMSPTPISTVIELFYPGGFAHDYEWTARALGHKHFAIWNDTYHTHPNLPWVAYPEGFQGTQIPVYAPTVIDIIKERIAGRLK